MTTELERKFQGEKVSPWLEELFPGCLIMKQDANYRQGIPDLLVLFNDKWAFLEVKKSDNETPRPNQPYYVAWAQERSFGAFIYPENAGEVLNALADFFRR